MITVDGNLLDCVDRFLESPVKFAKQIFCCSEGVISFLGSEGKEKIVVDSLQIFQPADFSSLLAKLQSQFNQIVFISLFTPALTPDMSTTFSHLKTHDGETYSWQRKVSPPKRKMNTRSESKSKTPKLSFYRYENQDPDYRDRYGNMRIILLSWLLEVYEEWDLEKLETMIMTIEIVDHFLKANRVEKEQLQLLGITALMLSSRLYEVPWGMTCEDANFITATTYSRIQISNFMCTLTVFLADHPLSFQTTSRFSTLYSLFPSKTRARSFLFWFLTFKLRWIGYSNASLTFCALKFIYKQHIVNEYDMESSEKGIKGFISYLSK